MSEAFLNGCLEEAASELESNGMKVEESCPKSLADLASFWTTIYAADGGEWVRKLLKESGTQHWDPLVNWLWQTPAFTESEITQLMIQWTNFRREILTWMNRYDVLICPVNARDSWRSGFGDDDEPGATNAFTYTNAVNTTGWPAAVIRGVTSDDGMPIGVQIVAPPWR